MSSRIVHVLVAMTLGLTTARADVLVVKSAGGDFTDIAAAVAAAQDGDIVLVYAGPVYSPFVIDGKSLTVTGANTPLTRAVTVRNLAPGQSVLLRWLTIAATSGPPEPLTDDAPGLVLENCQGSVRVQECYCQASDNPLGHDTPYAGARVTDCVDVGFDACTLSGGPGASAASSAFDASDGGSGLLLQDSRAWLHQTVLFGADGGNQSSDGPPHVGVGDGGHGARLQGASEIALAGCLVVAGKGGVQEFGLSVSTGGDGLHVGAGSIAHVRDSDIAGGTGTGKDGHTIAARPGTVQQIAAPARRLSCMPVVHPGETFAFQVDGEIGLLTSLLVSLEPRGAWEPSLLGAKLVPTPIGGATYPLGIIPPPGSLFVDQTAPPLGPGVDGLLVYVQLVVTGPGGMTLENGRSLLLLDASF